MWIGPVFCSRIPSVGERYRPTVTDFWCLRCPSWLSGPRHRSRKLPLVLLSIWRSFKPRAPRGGWCLRGSRCSGWGSGSFSCKGPRRTKRRLFSVGRASAVNREVLGSSPSDAVLKHPFVNRRFGIRRRIFRIDCIDRLDFADRQPLADSPEWRTRSSLRKRIL